MQEGELFPKSFQVKDAARNQSLKYTDNGVESGKTAYHQKRRIHGVGSRSLHNSHERRHYKHGRGKLLRGIKISVEHGGEQQGGNKNADTARV